MCEINSCNKHLMGVRTHLTVLTGGLVTLACLSLVPTGPSSSCAVVGKGNQTYFGRPLAPWTPSLRALGGISTFGFFASRLPRESVLPQAWSFFSPRQPRLSEPEPFQGARTPTSTTDHQNSLLRKEDFLTKKAFLNSMNGVQTWNLFFKFICFLLFNFPFLIF